MNSVLLLAMVVPIFILGYHYYARLLASSVFRPSNDNNSTPAREPDGGVDDATGANTLTVGQQLGAGLFASALGASIAAFWGWAPAFLWLVIATVVIAGTYRMATLWLAAHHGRTLIESVRILLGRRGARVFASLLAAVALAVGGLLVMLLAQLLARHTAAVLPFWLLIIVALALGAVLRRAPREWVPASAGAVLLALTVIWVASAWPLAINGSISVSVAGATGTLDAALLWLVALFAFALYAQRQPVAKLERPRAYLGVLLAALLLLLGIAGILLRHPELAMAPFNLAARPALPSVAAVLALGGLLGLPALMATTSMAARCTPRSGYAMALGVGLFALVSLLLAAGTNHDAWQAMALAAVSQTSAVQFVGLVVNGFGFFAAGLGMDAQLAATLAAVVLLTLLGAAIDALLRFQGSVLAQTLASPVGARARVAIVLGLAWLGYTVDPGGLNLWLLLGAANLLIAGVVLILIGLALHQSQRGAAVPLALGAGLVAVADWGLVQMVANGWAGAFHALIWPAVALFMVQAWLLGETALAWRRSERNRRRAKDLRSI